MARLLTTSPCQWRTDLMLKILNVKTFDSNQQHTHNYVWNKMNCWNMLWMDTIFILFFEFPPPPLLLLPPLPIEVKWISTTFQVEETKKQDLLGKRLIYSRERMEISLMNQSKVCFSVCLDRYSKVRKTIYVQPKYVHASVSYCIVGFSNSPFFGFFASELKKRWYNQERFCVRQSTIEMFFWKKFSSLRVSFGDPPLENF